MTDIPTCPHMKRITIHTTKGPLSDTPVVVGGHHECDQRQCKCLFEYGICGVKVTTFFDVQKATNENCNPG